MGGGGFPGERLCRVCVPPEGMLPEGGSLGAEAPGTHLGAGSLGGRRPHSRVSAPPPARAAAGGGRKGRRREREGREKRGGEDGGSARTCPAAPGGGSKRPPSRGGRCS